MENKELVEYKEGFFTKIKNKIVNIFKKQSNSSADNNLPKENNVSQNKSFVKSIEVEVDEEKTRIHKLQKAYQRGAILEEEIKQEDYQKLVELYEEQNKELEKQINQKKDELKKIIDGLKAS